MLVVSNHLKSQVKGRPFTRELAFRKRLTVCTSAKIAEVPRNNKSFPTAITICLCFPDLGRIEQLTSSPDMIEGCPFAARIGHSFQSFFHGGHLFVREGLLVLVRANMNMHLASMVGRNSGTTCQNDREPTGCAMFLVFLFSSCYVRLPVVWTAAWQPLPL